MLLGESRCCYAFNGTAEEISGPKKHIRRLIQGSFLTFLRSKTFKTLQIFTQGTDKVSEHETEEVKLSKLYRFLYKEQIRIVGTKLAPQKLVRRLVFIYYANFKITGDPCNLIGSQKCD